MRSRSILSHMRPRAVGYVLLVLGLLLVSQTALADGMQPPRAFGHGRSRTNHVTVDPLLARLKILLVPVRGPAAWGTEGVEQGVYDTLQKGVGSVVSGKELEALRSLPR